MVMVMKSGIYYNNKYFNYNFFRASEMGGKYSIFAFHRCVKVVVCFTHQNIIGWTKWYCLFLRTSHVFMSFE